MKKLDKETKYKLIYSGELMFFAILFLTFSILKFTHVMGYNPTRGLVFNIITLAGGTWGIIDFIWAISSKKRQQRISLLDKILLLPLALFILTYDFICLIAKPENVDFYIYSIGAAFAYIAAVYIFESIYHFYRPIPGLFDDEEEPQKPENSQEKPEK